MSYFGNLHDLQKYGINLLTGEADRLCLRVLCDVSEQGHTLLADFFGLPTASPSRRTGTAWSGTRRRSEASC